MNSNNEHKRNSRLAEVFMKLREEVTAIIEEGRHTGLGSEIIVDKIFGKAVVDKEIVVEEDKTAERPVSIKEIVLIAQKAVEQAAYEGVFIILPSGERIIRKRNFN